MRLTAVVPATNAPATLPRALAAIHGAADAPDEVIVVDRCGEPGPAAARNEGARRATGDVVAFVDADVEVHPDAFTRIRLAFADPSGPAAVFGSYDDRPAAPGVVSVFRNLLHHHVHQSSPGEVGTFWAGLGAVRREAFGAVGGFDAQRYQLPSVEDIELGMRLSAAGFRIELDPRIQGTHLKAWTVPSMLRTDLVHRGIPWTALLLRERSASASLNLGWRHRLGGVACLAGLGALAAQRLLVAALLPLVLVALNPGFYVLLLRRGGPLTATAGVGLHALHYLAAALAVPGGVGVYLLQRGSGVSPPSATPSPPEPG